MVASATGTRTKPVRVGDILGAIKKGHYREKIERIREKYARAKAAGLDPKSAVATLKRKLPGVLWSGEFKTRRKEVPLDQRLLRHSGILCADLDDIPARLAEVCSKLASSPYLIALFRSPTGTGLKALFRVPPDPTKHRASFEAVRKHVHESTGCEIDPACKDVTRLCFLSYDPEIVIKTRVQVIPIGEECTEETEETEDTEETEVIDVCDWFFQIRSLDDAVKVALPDKPHENNHHLFMLARGVKTLETQSGQKFSPAQHCEAFGRWHDAASAFLRPNLTKEDYWTEYLNAYNRAKYPLGSAIIARAWKLAQGQPLPAEALQFENPQRQLLVALCRQLQILNGKGPFYLSSRTCQRLFGHDSHTTAWKWLNALCVLRIIEKVESGTATRAPRFRYL
jgi:hypothetical protein